MHDVLVRNLKMGDVAAENQMSIQNVSLLCKKASKNKKYFDELISLRDEKQRRRELIA